MTFQHIRYKTRSLAFLPSLSLHLSANFILFLPYLAAFAAAEYCPPPGATGAPPGPSPVPAPPATPGSGRFRGLDSLI